MRKQRVQYSENEWKQLKEVAKTILIENPKINKKQLLVWSMGRLFNTDRMMGAGGIKNNCDEFYADVSNSIVFKKEILPKEETKETKETIEEVIPSISFSALEEAFNNQLKLLNAKVSKRPTIITKEVIREEKDLINFNKRLDRLENLARETKDLLLKVILTLDPTFFVKEDEKEYIEKLTPKKVLLKIAVVGLLGEQAHRLSEVCRDEELCLLTPYTNVKESTVKGFVNYDYVITTRHVGHNVSEKAIRDLGRDKVIHLDTTSIDRIIATIKRINNNPK